MLLNSFVIFLIFFQTDGEENLQSVDFMLNLKEK